MQSRLINLNHNSVDERPFGFCDNCERRYKQRLNVFAFNNGIYTYVCDKCAVKK